MLYLHPCGTSIEPGVLVIEGTSDLNSGKGEKWADLIILNRHPEIIADFINVPTEVPAVISGERVEYWAKTFHPIKSEFVKTFDIQELHETDLEAVYHLRNAIAHAHVSLGRDYFLYRPARGERQEQRFIDALGLSPVDNQADPMMNWIR